MVSFPFEQVPQCLPALATYLQNQENALNTVKSDLAATKQQLEQSIGKFVKSVWTFSLIAHQTFFGSF